MHVKRGTVFIQCQPKFLQPMGTKLLILKRKVQISLALQNPFLAAHERPSHLLPLEHLKNICYWCCSLLHQPLWESADVPGAPELGTLELPK